MSHIIVGIASVSNRFNNLKNTLSSLYEQVDEIHIFLNNYKGKYSWMQRPKITVYESKDHGDHGDAGKFFFAGKKAGYFFTCDDDLIYPKDYVKKTIEKIEFYKREAIVTYHGRIFRMDNIKSYYRDRNELYHCLNEVKIDKDVHFGGTGVMAFHSDTCNITKEVLPLYYKNMADIHIGIYAQKNKIQIKALAHKGGWIKAQKVQRDKENIYMNHRLNDFTQTQLVNNLGGLKIWS